MIQDKLKTLKKALLYSYQAETITLEDGREFRCLINPDKLKNDYDNKIISIPFKDICLNSDFLGIPTSYAEEPIDMRVGDIFYWNGTDTYWLVYLQFLEENAYFRAEIRKCTGTLKFNDKEYKAYIRGPVETTNRWNQKSNTTWNDLNYSKIAYIKEDEFTLSLKRFDVIKVDGENFQVQVVNKDTSSDGILIIYLKEYFSNTIEEENNSKEEELPPEVVSNIVGPTLVYPYDIKTYSFENGNGSWNLSNSKAKILKSNSSEVTIEIITGKTGEVKLSYLSDDGVELDSINIEIGSF